MPPSSRDGRGDPAPQRPAEGAAAAGPAAWGLADDIMALRYSAALAYTEGSWRPIEDGALCLAPKPPAGTLDGLARRRRGLAGSGTLGGGEARGPAPRKGGRGPGSGEASAEPSHLAPPPSADSVGSLHRRRASVAATAASPAAAGGAAGDASPPTPPSSRPRLPASRTPLAAADAWHALAGAAGAAGLDAHGRAGGGAGGAANGYGGADEVLRHSWDTAPEGGSGGADGKANGGRGSIGARLGERHPVMFQYKSYSSQAPLELDPVTTAAVLEAALGVPFPPAGPGGGGGPRGPRGPAARAGVSFAGVGPGAGGGAGRVAVVNPDSPFFSGLAEAGDGPGLAPGHGPGSRSSGGFPPTFPSPRNGAAEGEGGGAGGILGEAADGARRGKAQGDPAPAAARAGLAGAPAPGALPARWQTASALWDPPAEAAGLALAPLVSAGEAAAVALLKLALDLYVRVGPRSSFPLVLHMLQKALLEGSPEARARVFDVIFNLSIHGQILFGDDGSDDSRGTLAQHQGGAGGGGGMAPPPPAADSPSPRPGGSVPLVPPPPSAQDSREWQATVAAAFRVAAATDGAGREGGDDALRQAPSGALGSQASQGDVPGGGGERGGRLGNPATSSSLGRSRRHNRHESAAGGGAATFGPSHGVADGAAPAGAPLPLYEEWPPLPSNRPPLLDPRQERFSAWLRLLLFRLLRLLSSLEDVQDSAWASAFSILVHLSSVGGEPARAYLEDLPLRVVRALLDACRVNRWSDAALAWLLRVATNLLYVRESEQTGGTQYGGGGGVGVGGGGGGGAIAVTYGSGGVGGTGGYGGGAGSSAGYGTAGGYAAAGGGSYGSGYGAGGGYGGYGGGGAGGAAGYGGPASGYGCTPSPGAYGAAGVGGAHASATTGGGGGYGAHPTSAYVSAGGPGSGHQQPQQTQVPSSQGGPGGWFAGGGPGPGGPGAPHGGGTHHSHFPSAPPASGTAGAHGGGVYPSGGAGGGLSFPAHHSHAAASTGGARDGWGGGGMTPQAGTIGAGGGGYLQAGYPQGSGPGAGGYQAGYAQAGQYGGPGYQQGGYHYGMAPSPYALRDTASVASAPATASLRDAGRRSLRSPSVSESVRTGQLRRGGRGDQPPPPPPGTGTAAWWASAQLDPDRLEELGGVRFLAAAFAHSPSARDRANLFCVVFDHVTSAARGGGDGDSWAPALEHAAHSSEVGALGAALARTRAAGALRAPFLASGGAGATARVAAAVAVQMARAQAANPARILSVPPALLAEVFDCFEDVAANADAVPRELEDRVQRSLDVVAGIDLEAAGGAGDSGVGLYHQGPSAAAVAAAADAAAAAVWDCLVDCLRDRAALGARCARAWLRKLLLAAADTHEASRVAPDDGVEELGDDGEFGLASLPAPTPPGFPGSGTTVGGGGGHAAADPMSGSPSRGARHQRQASRARRRASGAPPQAVAPTALLPEVYSDGCALAPGIRGIQGQDRLRDLLMRALATTSDSGAADAFVDAVGALLVRLRLRADAEAEPRAGGVAPRERDVGAPGRAPEGASDEGEVGSVGDGPASEYTSAADGSTGSPRWHDAAEGNDPRALAIVTAGAAVGSAGPPDGRRRDARRPRRARGASGAGGVPRDLAGCVLATLSLAVEWLLQAPPEARSGALLQLTRLLLAFLVEDEERDEEESGDEEEEEGEGAGDRDVDDGSGWAGAVGAGADAGWRPPALGAGSSVGRLPALVGAGSGGGGLLGRRGYPASSGTGSLPALTVPGTPSAMSVGEGALVLGGGPDSGGGGGGGGGYRAGTASDPAVAAAAAAAAAAAGMAAAAGRGPTRTQSGASQSATRMLGSSQSPTPSPVASEPSLASGRAGGTGGRTKAATTPPTSSARSAGSRRARDLGTALALAASPSVAPPPGLLALRRAAARSSARAARAAGRGRPSGRPATAGSERAAGAPSRGGSSTPGEASAGTLGLALEAAPGSRGGGTGSVAAGEQAGAAATPGAASGTPGSRPGRPGFAGPPASPAKTPSVPPGKSSAQRTSSQLEAFLDARAVVSSHVLALVPPRLLRTLFEELRPDAAPVPSGSTAPSGSAGGSAGGRPVAGGAAGFMSPAQGAARAARQAEASARAARQAEATRVARTAVQADRPLWDARAAVLLLLLGRCRDDPSALAAVGGAAFFASLLGEPDPLVRHLSATFVLRHVIASSPDEYRKALRAVVFRAQAAGDETILADPYGQLKAMMDLQLVRLAL